jgi:hypothetical protein
MILKLKETMPTSNLVQADSIYSTKNKNQFLVGADP